MTTHTVDTLMALADEYADAECSDYLTGEASSLWYRDNLRTALTEALSQPNITSYPEKDNSAQPVRAPLTNEQMLKAIKHLYKNEWIAEQALNVSIDDFRAIERAHNIGIENEKRTKYLKC